MYLSEAGLDSVAPGGVVEVHVDGRNACAMGGNKGNREKGK